MIAVMADVKSNVRLPGTILRRTIGTISIASGPDFVWSESHCFGKIATATEATIIVLMITPTRKPNSRAANWLVSIIDDLDAAFICLTF